MTTLIVGDHAQEVGERYLTPAELSVRLGIARVTLYQWIYAGKLRAVKIGKFVRIPESEIVRLIEVRQNTHGNQGTESKED